VPFELTFVEACLILTPSLVARIIGGRFIAMDYAQPFPGAGEHRFGDPFNYNFLLRVSSAVSSGSVFI
jgi:hypothetical protein